MPLKPMLSVDGLIAHSKEKGITFEIISEDEAKEYLGRNNNYFKLSSYRKNYTKFPSGPRKDQYRDLDFAYLIELARIDVEVRHILLKMCLDIEHFLKVSLIKAVENNLQAGNGEDGYKIVTDFITDASGVNFEERAKNISKRSGAISRKIGQNTKNPYCEGLMRKYRGEMPIWVFVEVIWKTLLHFMQQNPAGSLRLTEGVLTVSGRFAMRRRIITASSMTCGRRKRLSEM